MKKAEVISRFGVDPGTIGNRHRGWWIVEKIDEEEESGGAMIGDLCVKTRDGASNQIDMKSLKIKNCIGTAEDGFDRTYRYYYFTPIALTPSGQDMNQ